MILDRSTADKDDHWEQEADSHLQASKSAVTPDERSARFGQQPCTVLLTGLAGAGKTSLAYAVERRLFDRGRAATVLDGQNMRQGISRDLGFTASDRSENLRRSSEAAKLLNDAGLIVLGAFVAPEDAARKKAGDVVGHDRFLVVHLDAPVDVCRERDQEGHYAAADSGEIANFPGVSAPYEAPADADLRLDTAKTPLDECVEAVMKLLEKRGVIKG